MFYLTLVGINQTLESRGDMKILNSSIQTTLVSVVRWRLLELCPSMQSICHHSLLEKVVHPLKFHYNKEIFSNASANCLFAWELTIPNRDGKVSLEKTSFSNDLHFRVVEVPFCSWRIDSLSYSDTQNTMDWMVY